MSFKLLMIRDARPETELMEELLEPLQAAVPGIDVVLARSQEEAAEHIESVEAAFGNVVPALFPRAHKLRWVMGPQAGPDPSFYHPALVASDVVVTNMRGIFSDYIGTHILGFVLAFARGLHLYRDLQAQRVWQPNAPTVFLPESTALIVGLGGIGAETARLCAAFHMRVLALDPRTTDQLRDVAELAGSDQLDEWLPRADFVIVTVPQTPATQRLFNLEKFRRMRQGAYFINIGRGATVVLDDLNTALREGSLAGAALDVYETEPLPSEHPLWDAPGMIMTPHTAAHGPYLNDRRREVFIDNCRRFAAGKPLRNLVDKANWF